MIKHNHPHICSAHDSIKTLAEKIRSELSRPDPDLDLIDNLSYGIITTVGIAKEMGIKMEEGLRNKQDKIDVVAHFLRDISNSVQDVYNEMDSDFEMELSFESK